MNFDNRLEASKFETAKLRYKIRLEDLLNSIYSCYKILISDKIKVEKKENKIRDVLVDNYLSPKLTNFIFKKEKTNQDGRVDIYIIDKLGKEEPHFIIECKLLDNKNTKESLSGKYISNGVLRFLTEHYYLDNNFYTNAMIGFIITTTKEENVVNNINTLSKKMLNNLAEIKKEITLKNPNLYISLYQTGKPLKDFTIYHLMMDFSKNLK